MLQQMHDKSVILQTASKFNTFLDLISQNCMLSVLKILDDVFTFRLTNEDGIFRFCDHTAVSR